MDRMKEEGGNEMLSLGGKSGNNYKTYFPTSLKKIASVFKAVLSYMQEGGASPCLTFLQIRCNVTCLNNKSRPETFYATAQL